MTEKSNCEDDPEVPDTLRKNGVNDASDTPPAGEKSSPFRSLFTIDFSESPVYIKDKQTSDTVKADNYKAAGVSKLGFLPTVSHTGPCSDLHIFWSFLGSQLFTCGNLFSTRTWSCHPPSVVACRVVDKGQALGHFC